jgi:hypothetical protein
VPGLCLAILGFARTRALAAIAIVIEMVVFAYGYNPAAKPVPMIDLPKDDRFFISAEFEVFPPNLATLQQVRDVREYDVLRSGEPRAKPRWLVTYRGIVEQPGAVPQPMPKNEPPPGLILGLAISLAALAIESFLHDRHAPG